MTTQNFVWKFFLETTIHQKLSRIYARNKGKNTIVTGYPGMDILLEKKDVPNNVWKISDKNIKRIIWAPHHTIPGFGDTLDYSTFFYYHDYFFEIARKYREQIQVAFKPHPILRAKLSKPEVWGKDKTDSYYKNWEELENGQLNETGYIDLFLTSDAMIHDSSSFVIEYLYTKKPVMFLLHNEKIKERFNELGKLALKELYQGRQKEDIQFFIEEVILRKNDLRKTSRNKFFEELIRPPNELTASQNIFNYLNQELVLK